MGHDIRQSKDRSAPGVCPVVTGHAPHRASIGMTPEKHERNLDATVIYGSMSRPLETLVRLHREANPDLRLIQAWTERPLRLQSWELEAGAAKLVLSVVHHFVTTPPLRLHGILGQNQDAPTFDTIVTGDGTTDIPKDAMYFIEDESTGERMLLEARDLGGETILSFDARQPSGRIDALRDFARVHNYLRGQVFDLRGNILDFTSIDPADIILTDTQRTLIDRHVIGFANGFSGLRNRKAKLTRGILLEGEPGCGKSMLLRSLAKRLNGFSVCLASPSQFSDYCSVDVLDTIIKMTAPCAVFMEEIDLFGGDRGIYANPELAELMQLMDGLRTIPGVLWIGTTNRPDVVEQALANRPGRFDRRIRFGPLDDAPRSVLIDRLIRPQQLTPEAKADMLSLTVGWTGAQIRELCETLRLLGDANEFDSADIQKAVQDCGFNVRGTFGFSTSNNMVD